MNQKEKNLFLELCAFRNSRSKRLERLIRNGAATSGVLGMLFANRMAGVAYYVLKQTRLLDMVDREFRNSIRNASVYNQETNKDFLYCVKQLSATLEACGVPYALLKGAYLCHWYPQGCRTSNDIDILVAPEDVGSISAALKRAGFEQGYLKNGVFVPATRQQIIESKMTRGETVPFIRKINLPHLDYLEVDLNFSLDYKNSNDTTLKKMLCRAQITTVDSERIRILDPLDFILHLCEHLYKEATTIPWVRMKRDMTFYKYTDIYGLLTDLDKRGLSELKKRAEENGMKTELFYCLQCIQVFFKKSFPISIELTEDERGTLDRVISPAEKKIYHYTESDILKRFFAYDRMKLLEVVE